MGQGLHHQRFMQPRYAGLSRLGFSCPEPEGASRLAELLDLVEFAFERAAGRPVLIRIARDKFQVRGWEAVKAILPWPPDEALL